MRFWSNSKFAKSKSARILLVGIFTHAHACQMTWLLCAHACIRIRLFNVDWFACLCAIHSEHMMYVTRFDRCNNGIRIISDWKSCVKWCVHTIFINVRFCQWVYVFSVAKILIESTNCDALRQMEYINRHQLFTCLSANRFHPRRLLTKWS